MRLKHLLLALALLLAPRLTHGQVSGVGIVGCPSATLTGTVANSGTANNTVLLSITGTPCPAVLVQLDQTTTITGGAISFQLSNDLGGSFTNVPVAQVLNQSTFAQLTNPYTLVASTNQAFFILLNGATSFQVKLTTALTGSGAVTPYVTPTSLPPAFTLDAAGNQKVNLNASTASVTISGTVTTSPPSNASTNIAQIGGSAPSTGTGAGGAGIPRVTVSNDSSLAANQSVNESQINGVTPLMNNGASGTGSQRTNVANDNSAIANWGHGATGSAVPANATAEGLKDTAGNMQDALADTNGRQLVKPYPDTTTTSYHASNEFTASSTTDNAIMPGNATNTVLLTRVIVTCTQTTAGVVSLELLKRSTADTGGTSSALTKVPDDSNYAAAVSAPLTYTGTGPTTGTAVGDLDNARFGCNATGTAGPNDIYIFSPRKPIVLRGTAQQVAINFGGAITGGTLSVTFEWMETTTP